MLIASRTQRQASLFRPSVEMQSSGRIGMRTALREEMCCTTVSLSSLALRLDSIYGRREAVPKLARSCALLNDFAPRLSGVCFTKEQERVAQNGSAVSGISSRMYHPCPTNSALSIVERGFWSFSLSCHLCQGISCALRGDKDLLQTS